MKKKVLVTAGSTAVPIDQVRSISNIFRGKTGAAIAIELAEKGLDVTLVTSDLDIFSKPTEALSRIITFKTYDELYALMEKEIWENNYDVIIHSAAVSDYRVSTVCVMEDGKLKAIDSGSKVSSSHSELYLRLSPTQKIIDLIRDQWGFSGYLVKFKLQVGIADEELITIAQESRVHSQADMIVANCLEWSRDRAYLITESDLIDIPRKDLSNRIYELIFLGV